MAGLVRCAFSLFFRFSSFSCLMEIQDSGQECGPDNLTQCDTCCWSPCGVRPVRPSWARKRIRTRMGKRRTIDLWSVLFSLPCLYAYHIFSHKLDICGRSQSSMLTIYLQGDLPQQPTSTRWRLRQASDGQNLIVEHKGIWLADLFSRHYTTNSYLSAMLRVYISIKKYHV